MTRRRRILVGLLLGTCVLAASLWWGGRAALHHEPTFYKAALAQAPERHEELGRELEKEVLDLRNQLRHPGRWEAEFGADELNGWLASDLPEKFPDLLPPEAQAPRVEVADGVVRVAFRFQDAKVRTVVSLALAPRIADQPNRIAIRVVRARAGALPLPLDRVLDQVSQAARRAELPLAWSQDQGDPVALVSIHPRHPEFPKQEVELDLVEVRGDRVVLGGRVLPEITETSDKPRDR